MWAHVGYHSYKHICWALPYTHYRPRRMPKAYCINPPRAGRFDDFLLSSLIPHTLLVCIFLYMLINQFSAPLKYPPTVGGRTN